MDIIFGEALQRLRQRIIIYGYEDNNTAHTYTRAPLAIAFPAHPITKTPTEFRNCGTEIKIITSDVETNTHRFHVQLLSHQQPDPPPADGRKRRFMIVLVAMRQG